MNGDEAQHIATQFLAAYRAKPYAELVGLVGTIQTHEIVAPSGIAYQLELQALWDDPSKPNEVLRVIVSVDDRGLRAFVPVSEVSLIGPAVDAHAASNNWRGP